MTRPITLALVAALSLCAPAALGQAPPRTPDAKVTAEARAAFDAGLKLSNASKFEEARAQFVIAWEAGRLPKALVNIARSDQLLGRHADAENEFRAYLRLPDATPEISNIARKYLAELEPLVAHVTVDASVDGLSIDGKKTPLEALRDPVAVAPGLHAFELRQGEKVDRWSAELKAGETLKLPRAPEPTPPAVPSKVAPLPVERPTQPKPVEAETSSWTSTKVVVVSTLSVVVATSLALSAGFFVGAGSRADDLARYPGTSSCFGVLSPECSARLEATDARTSNVNTGRAFLGAGIALGLGALGTALFWDPRSAPSRATVQPLLSPTTAGIGVAGHF